MKYVVLGKIGPRWGEDPVKRVEAVHTKLHELNITPETILYTQGPYDFVEVVRGEPRAMLALSLWYNTQGFGQLTTLPAFTMPEVHEAVEQV
ncbi:MAG: GYD domain-containing protein [Myxococcota bacterium]